MIPTQLKSMKFNRVLFKTKKPFEKDWTNKPYTYDEISEYFPCENYGVMTGINQLGVLDDDSEDKRLIKLFEDNFGDTFKVNDHLYFKIKHWEGQTIKFWKGGDSSKRENHLGELQGKGAMVVGAGSTHPTGKKYELIKDVPIKEIDFEIFKAVFSEYLIEKKEVPEELKQRSNWEGDDIKDIPINAVISLAGLNDVGGAYQGSHPLHGSSGGMNFRVDTSSNTWYCFRCNAGGSSPELIAVMEGIIDCSEAGRGCLAGDKGSQVIKFAREKYGLKAPEIKQEEKKPMGWACSVDIKKLAEDYDLSKCPKCNVDFNFNEKLGFFKCSSCGDFGGLKVFALMCHKKKLEVVQ